jgi:hypothetical protein
VFIEKDTNTIINKMRTFKEILSELGEKLDASLAQSEQSKPSEASHFPFGRSTIGSAKINGGNYDLFIYKTEQGSYLYQMGESHEAPIGRTKAFLKQDFVTLNNTTGIAQELAYQKEKEGGFWFNEAAPKLLQDK